MLEDLKQEIAEDDKLNGVQQPIQNEVDKDKEQYEFMPQGC